ncbi:MAG: PEP-CTERM sorting domain-containing protein [Bythopirellula sp.]|nr:PEP-CTERM sorting domain-containing protein [Bythopirellula sp.]
MKCVKFSLFAAMALAISAYGSQVSAQNLLVNPGFEDPVTSDGPPFFGSWEAFSNGGPNISTNGTVMPRSGLQELNLTLVDPNSFAGAFQDVLVTEGNEYTWCGWHKLLSGNPGGTEVRIEWRNATAEVGRTANLVPPISSDYTKWSLTANALPGATIARVVYAIQSFGAPAPQNVLVDDVSFTCIPEPASMVLVGLAGVALFGFRRSAK